jgi:dihydrofolate reductase
MTVNLIAAVGKRGQIGRGGFLPWAEPHDLRMFRDMTIGGVVIAGYRTWETIQFLPRRELVCWQREDPAKFLALLGRRFQAWPIWIAGGAATYRAFAPFVDGLRLISAIDYDNDPAEDGRHVFFPFDAYSIRWGGERG